MDYASYPRPVVEDIIRLRRRIDRSRMPAKITDHNLLVGTWNIRSLGRLYEHWDENPRDPKRNLRGMAYIAEIVRRFDVLAIQEVKQDTDSIRMLSQQWLGADWGLILSDVSAGQRGNSERLAFLYDKRRVQPSGLAGEIVLPPEGGNDPAQQFDRTPYIVGFQTGRERFTLLTAHIRYGDSPQDRMGEIKAMAEYTARELKRRAGIESEENNLLVLGDFNIDERGGNPLFQAFVSTGLVVPEALLHLKTTYDTKPKFYDQIAWFMGDMTLLVSGEAGVIDFSGAVYKDRTLQEMSYRVSDHFPLWVEFIVDRSVEQLAKTLDKDPAAPGAFDSIPD
jgi:endonuclease/exonuclease/phosphatase family metal-dependent hydrolase